MNRFYATGLMTLLALGLAGQAQAENPKVAMDIEIGGEPAGTVVAELRADVVPHTAENFRRICADEDKIIGRAGKPLDYDGTPFHRIIPGFMIQGGDITRGNGKGGDSIFGGRFRDENFRLKHGDAGVLSMANSGPGTNSSQFFITVAPTPWLDGKHVVFGHVVEGMDVVKKMEEQGTQKGKTRRKVILADCREIKEPVQPDVQNETEAQEEAQEEAQDQVMEEAKD